MYIIFNDKKRKPFLLKQNESELFSRFLVEENNNDYLMLNLFQTQQIGIIRSTFKTAIGNYDIIYEEEEKMVEHEIYAVIFNFLF